MICIDEKEAVDDLFRIGMLWRIGYGALRVILGLALLRVVGTPIIDLIKNFMSHELIEDKTDFLFNLVDQGLHHQTLYVTYFLATYFIFWGVVDIFLSINLLRGKLWAFPVSMFLIGGFVVYSIFRYTHTHSLFLLWIILFDIVILALIYKEYRLLIKPE